MQGLSLGSGDSVDERVYNDPRPEELNQAAALLRECNEAANEAPKPHSHCVTCSEASQPVQEGGLPSKAHQDRDADPIAIVGMACRLPGGVTSPDEFWKFLLEKREGLCTVPDTRYSIDGFYSPTRTSGVRTRKGYFLEEHPGAFDAPFFHITDYEASRMDPQQRKLLEVVWECFENAGETGWRGREVGCFVGVFGEDWLDLASKDTLGIDRYHVLGTGGFALSNRISYEYDFRGPSMTIQTGCSASMVALHEACQALYSGECGSAIVAGTNLINSPTMTTTMSANLVLSPTGVCRTFDKSADGYGRGEAINAIYIKRLDDAVAAGDPIQGIIRATATNCDGNTPSITTPGAASQERLIRRAYERAQIPDISRTAYFECHGTGTVAGDTAELSVIQRLFEGRDILIGAVKPNVGHSEGASGITSMIKAVMSLQNQTIPPNIYFESPNPNIPFKKIDMNVPIDSMAWPMDKEKRISINCFGIGGANAHTIVESGHSYASLGQSDPGAEIEQSELLVVSAHDPVALRTRIAQMCDYLNANPATLPSLSFTLGARREPLEHRAFAVAQPNTALFPSGFRSAQAASPQLTWVFTGQGAQWPGMGADLMSAFPSFGLNMDRMTETLYGLKDGPSWSLTEELAKTEPSSQVNRAEFSQPLCTALQIGIVDLLRGWGIKPDLVVGHSSGEVAAAYAAGAITMSSAIIIAYYRGLMAKTKEGTGAMAAVGLGTDDVQPYLDGLVKVACENSPRSVTLSGSKEHIDRVIESIKADDPDIFCRRLKVNVAYHSSDMDGIGPAYEDYIRPHIVVQKEMTALVSSVTGSIITTPGQLDARYWRSNLEQPVRFAGAVDKIIQQATQQVFCEIGPHSALSGALRQIFQACESLKADPIYIPTLTRHDTDARGQLLWTAGYGYACGVSTNLQELIGAGRTLTDLPNYPWQREKTYWHESRVSAAWRSRACPDHELLGSRVPQSTDLEPSWRNLLRLDDVPWLCDHVIQSDIVFPAAGYIAMAGEAIRQLHDGSAEESNYSIKNVLFKVPLILKEQQELELLTSLKPVKYTDMTDSDWYSFTISGHDGTSWTKHCQGEVQWQWDHAPDTPQVSQYERAVNSRSWYNVLDRQGLKYGPRFRGLRDISVSPSQYRAAATIPDDPNAHESRYLVHPTALDQSLQLMSVAMSNGVARRIDRLAIPLSIGRVFVGRGAPSMQVEVRTNSGYFSSNAFDGCMVAEDNRPVVHLEQAAFFTHHNEPNEASGGIPLTSQIRWQKDIDHQPATELLRPPQPSPAIEGHIRRCGAACLLYILETAERLRDVEPVEPHLGKWREWIQQTAVAIRDGQHADLFPDSITWHGMDTQRRQSLIQDYLTADPGDGDDWDPVYEQCMGVMFDHVIEIVTGQTSALELLMEQDRLSRYYSFVQYCDWSKFLGLLGHSNPTMRILEIGAGTGSATSTALRHLQTAEAVRTYSQFVFSDISPGFVSAAKERFKSYTGMEYQVLDITRDPEEQGFAPHSFDLVIACNVLHATPCLQTALRHVQTLLAPRGWLLLNELDPNILTTDYIMGALPGWWMGDGDRRVSKPYVSPQRWHEELVEAGFSGADAVQYDFREPWQSNFTLLSRPLTTHTRKESQISLLVRDSAPGPWAQELQLQFTKQGYACQFVTLGDKPVQGDFIISLLDRESPFLSNISRDNYALFQDFFTGSTPNDILWITSSAQVKCADPSFGLIFGFARTMCHETGMRFSTLEIDTYGSHSLTAVFDIFQELQRVDSGPRAPDREFLFHDRQIYTGRCHWVPPSDLTLIPDDSSDGAKRLSIAKTGQIDSLEWVDVKPTELGDDEVDIEMHYTGLNFKDIMAAMGLIADPAGFGLEGSGVVRRVGPSVTKVCAGDEVAVIGQGFFRTRVFAPAGSVVKLPPGLGLQDAATMLTVFATAIYSLIHIGGLQKGQSVLIHSACGGVGLASIQICQLVGAKIYATVGSEEKVEFLMQNFDIPRHHIFDSHSTSFKPQLLHETNQRGVDIVLNSLAGRLLHASWECVAPFGRMIELGKRDIFTHGILNMLPFGRNRAFFGVDMLQVADHCPDIFQGLLTQFEAWYAAGHIRPIRPIHLFDYDKVAEAFRFMQKGVHIGKILVKMTQDVGDSILRTTNPGTKQATVSFSPTASYLLVGGLGGLGQSVATWMVERGARRFVFLSPSAGESEESHRFMRELAALACTCRCISGNVAIAADVERAIGECPEEYPLAGVIHVAMKLEDRTFGQLSYEQWNTVLAPKVQGAWNLHHAVQHLHLDFFVCFGSVSGVGGNTSQANYAAANTFLNSLAQYRRQNGLPSAVLDLGAVEDVGLVSKDPGLLRRLRGIAQRLLSEQEVIQGLEIAILQSRRLTTSTNSLSQEDEFVSNQCIVGLNNTKPLSDPGTRPVWTRDAKYSLYESLSTKTVDDGTALNDELKALLARVEADPGLLDDESTRKTINRELAKLTTQHIPQAGSVDEDGLGSIAIDSLMSIEIKSWVRRVLKIELSLVEISKAGTVGALTDLIIEHLRAKYNS